MGKQTHAYIKETKSLANRIERALEFLNSIKIKDEDEVPHTFFFFLRKIKLDSVCMWFSASTCFPFPFLLLSFLDSFLVFSYAYGGLHGWSPRGEKAAKVRFDSQRKHKKKKVTEKGKKSEASTANVAKKKKCYFATPKTYFIILPRHFTTSHLSDVLSFNSIH